MKHQTVFVALSPGQCAVRLVVYDVYMEHPKTVGDRTTLAVMLALEAAGFGVLLPFGENTRYDLVIDDGVKLARVQCKTGRIRGSCVIFATCSTYGHHRAPKQARRSYHGQVDFFAVYCPDNGEVYFVPIEDLQTHSSAMLRLEPTRNGQRRGVRYAAPYRLGHVTTEPVSVGEATKPVRGLEPPTHALQMRCSTD